jgi:oligopeptide/dipeptide ABC transporter ATP-binding protein
MYAGRIVEQGGVADILRTPLHPYTRALLASVPRVARAGRDPSLRLLAIPGQVPSPAALPPGCAFASRCPLAIDRCRESAPPEEAAGDKRTVRCHRWREG